MPINRFFYEGDLNAEQTISLEDAEHHHLAHVTKNRIGDQVEIINGCGILAMAKIIKIERRSASLLIQKVEKHPNKDKELILAQAIVRMNRLDTIIEKATELGVTSIWLFPAQESERELLLDSQIQRLQTVAISAIKQCGRLYLPQILLYFPILKWEKQEGFLFFGDVEIDAPPLWKEEFSSQRNLFVTGPESGLTPEEVHHLRLIGGKGVSLHKNILRTDTASIAALTLLSQKKTF